MVRSSTNKRKNMGIASLLLLVSFVTNVTPFFFSPLHNRPNNHHYQLRSSPSILQHKQQNKQQPLSFVLYNTNDNSDESSKKKSLFGRLRDKIKKKKGTDEAIDGTIINDGDGDSESLMKIFEEEEEEPTEPVQLDADIMRLVKEAEDTITSAEGQGIVLEKDEINSITEEAKQEVVENDLEEEEEPTAEKEEEYGSRTAPTSEDDDAEEEEEEDEENMVVVEVGDGAGDSGGGTGGLGGYLLSLDTGVAAATVEYLSSLDTGATADDTNNDDIDTDGDRGEEVSKTFMSGYLTTLTPEPSTTTTSIQDETNNNNEEDDSISIEEQQALIELQQQQRIQQQTQQREQDALNLIRRYLQDRDSLDYYYYDQDQLSEEYILQEEEGKTNEPARILSTLVNFFRGSDDDGDGDEGAGDGDRRPLLPSQIVEEYFAEDAEYIDGNYYRTAVGARAIVRHLGLFGSRRSLFEKKTKTKVSSSDNDNEESEEEEEEQEIEDGVKMLCDDIALQQDDSTNDDNDASTSTRIKVVTTYHYEYSDGSTVPDSRGIASYTLSSTSTTGELRIAKVVDFMEPPSPKPGDSGLKLLSFASDVMAATSSSESTTATAPTPPTDTVVVVDDKDTIIVEEEEEEEEMKEEGTTPTEKYFQAFNARNIPLAVSYVTDDCEYIDTQYPGSTFGKAALETQFTRVAKALPPTFRFVVDDVVEDVGRGTVGVQWHVEDDDEKSDTGSKELPFTRGFTFNRLQGEQISYALDVPEPAVIKSGAFLRVKNLIQNDPIRLLPLTVWALYTYIVFFSDGIIPGANALQLEGRTWEEVRDLSLNFFLVSPTLNLPFAPTTHPILEGVFNLLLSWAALFSGFLSDEREDKPNVLEMGWVVLGMQFLTSAFYLPYLVSRTPESPRLILNDGTKPELFYDDGDDDLVIEIDFDAAVTRQDIKGQQIQSKIAENKKFHAVLGAVGSYSILWGIFARADDGFGTTLPDRLDSFGELMAIDRVGFSFLVDLAIFGLFQGWLVDDDLRRRGLDPELTGTLRTVGKYVPFFGLVAYLLMRPALPSSVPFSDDKSDETVLVEDDATTAME